MYTRKTPIAAATIVGPATKPSSPNASNPPNTPMNKSSSFSRVLFRNNIGRTILSAIVDTPPQITTTSNAFPQCPLTPSQSTAGPQMSAEPTTGTSEKKAISTPQNVGEEIPTNANDSPPSAPWITATSKPTATLANTNSFDSSTMSV